jgi:hypothetical protein
LIFPDFFEWLSFVCENAIASGHDYYIKPHPNGVAGNEEVLAFFKEKYKTIKFLPAQVSNRRIFENNFDAAFTVYGTIAHELAYKGIKVINAGVNPHIAFNFCAHPKNREELADWVQNFHLKSLTINKDDVCRFCYVHNYRLLKHDFAHFKKMENPLYFAELLANPERVELINKLVESEFEAVGIL